MIQCLKGSDHRLKTCFWSTFDAFESISKELVDIFLNFKVYSPVQNGVSNAINPFHLFYSILPFWVMILARCLKEFVSLPKKKNRLKPVVISSSNQVVEHKFHGAMVYDVIMTSLWLISNFRLLSQNVLVFFYELFFNKMHLFSSIYLFYL